MYNISQDIKKCYQRKVPRDSFIDNYTIQQVLTIFLFLGMHCTYSIYFQAVKKKMLKNFYHCPILRNICLNFPTISASV